MLHELSGGTGEALLCLHELGGRADDWRDRTAAWSGPVFALDFSGHGQSSWLRGGGYTPELLAADADAADEQVDEATHLPEPVDGVPADVAADPTDGGEGDGCVCAHTRGAGVDDA